MSRMYPNKAFLFFPATLFAIILFSLSNLVQGDFTTSYISSITILLHAFSFLYESRHRMFARRFFNTKLSLFSTYQCLFHNLFLDFHDNESTKTRPPPQTNQPSFPPSIRDWIDCILNSLSCLLNVSLIKFHTKSNSRKSILWLLINILHITLLMTYERHLPIPVKFLIVLIIYLNIPKRGSSHPLLCRWRIKSIIRLKFWDWDKLRTRIGGGGGRGEAFHLRNWQAYYLKK